MRTIKPIKGIAAFIILTHLLFSCSSKQEETVSSDKAITDSLLLSRIDSIYTYPLKMRNTFREAQKQLADSASYYKLELFIGFSLYIDGHQDSLSVIHQRVLDFCKRTPGTAAVEAICWNHRAVIQQFENKRDSALICLHHAYNALIHSPDRRELTSICVNIADMYSQNGDLPQSAAYYQKALSIADSIRTPREKYSIYVGLAQTYSSLYNFSMADYYFQLAESASANSLPQEQVVFYCTKGNSLYLRNKYKPALDCYKRSYEISTSFKDSYFNTNTEINMGELYILLNQTDSARYYLDKAYSFLLHTENANQNQLFYLNSLYASLALKENDLTAANQYLSKTYTTNIASSIYLHNKRLMDYYVQRQDFKKAYHYREIVDQYDDSLRNVRNISNITEMSYRYSQDTTLLKRDVIIANNKAQLSQQKGIILLSIALLIIFILLAITIILHTHRKNERKYNQQMTVIAKLRMETIRNRISPHYVFNVLNATMPAFKQYSNLAHPLQLLIDVLRGNLLVSDKIAVELGKEVELVKNYVTLRKETNPDTADVIWKIEKNIPMNILIPSMIIQIPVENSLKHAFDDMKNKDNQVSISISQTDNGISIHIKDNGSGYQPGKQSESAQSTGTGLKVLFRTIDLLNRKNQQKASFDIQNLKSNKPEQHGTLISIFIPFNYLFNF